MPCFSGGYTIKWVKSRLYVQVHQDCAGINWLVIIAIVLVLFNNTAFQDKMNSTVIEQPYDLIMLHEQLYLCWRYYSSITVTFPKPEAPWHVRCVCTHPQRPPVEIKARDLSRDTDTMKGEI